MVSRSSVILFCILTLACHSFIFFQNYSSSVYDSYLTNNFIVQVFEDEEISYNYTLFDNETSLLESRIRAMEALLLQQDGNDEQSDVEEEPVVEGKIPKKKDLQREISTLKRQVAEVSYYWAQSKYDRTKYQTMYEKRVTKMLGNEDREFLFQNLLQKLFDYDEILAKVEMSHRNDSAVSVKQARHYFQTAGHAKIRNICLFGLGGHSIFSLMQGSINATFYIFDENWNESKQNLFNLLGTVFPSRIVKMHEGKLEETVIRFLLDHKGFECDIMNIAKNYVNPHDLRNDFKTISPLAAPRNILLVENFKNSIVKEVWNSSKSPGVHLWSQKEIDNHVLKISKEPVVSSPVKLTEKLLVNSSPKPTGLFIEKSCENDENKGGWCEGSFFTTREKLTAVTMGYIAEGERRQNQHRLLVHYSQMHHLFEDIVFIWNNLENPPPKFPRTAVPIHVYQSPKNSLNNRWVKFPEEKTEGLMVFDDDLLLNVDEVENGFDVWKFNRDRLVGTSSRSYRFDAKTRLYDYSFGQQDGQFCMVLPRTMWLHVNFTHLYSNVMSKEIRNYVDYNPSHCDDIALNAVVGNWTKKGPIWAVMNNNYEGNLPEGDSGLNHQGNRQPSRGECLTWIIRQYPVNPFQWSNYKVFTLDDGTCNFSPQELTEKVAPYARCSKKSVQ